jgi:hypothetical protein
MHNTEIIIDEQIFKKLLREGKHSRKMREMTRQRYKTLKQLANHMITFLLLCTAYGTSRQRYFVEGNLENRQRKVDSIMLLKEDLDMLGAGLTNILFHLAELGYVVNNYKWIFGQFISFLKGTVDEMTELNKTKTMKDVYILMILSVIFPFAFLTSHYNVFEKVGLDGVGLFGYELLKGTVQFPQDVTDEIIQSAFTEFTYFYAMVMELIKLKGVYLLKDLVSVVLDYRDIGLPKFIKQAARQNHLFSKNGPRKYIVNVAGNYSSAIIPKKVGKMGLPKRLSVEFLSKQLVQKVSKKVFD